MSDRGYPAGALGCVPRRVLAAMLMVFIGPVSSGATPDQPLAQMSHKSWTARDGAPQGVRALAQGPDGTLWVGSEAGLFNFDGRSFHAFRPPPGEPELPAGPILTVCIGRDGTVWVGTMQGAARIGPGRVTLYSKVGENPIGRVDALRAAADGSIWGASRPLLVRFTADGTARLEPTPLPISTNAIGGIGIFIDSSNTLWLGQGGRLFRRPLNQSEYFSTDVRMDFIFGFAETPDGSLWIADVDTGNHDHGRAQRVDRTGKVVGQLPLLELIPNSILLAPDGSLVMAAQDVGLRRFRADAMANEPKPASGQGAENFGIVEGLSSDASRALLLDADGNIWIGGRRGLDRFRTAQLQPFSPEVLTGHWSICADNGGDIWLADDAHAQIYKVSGVSRQVIGKTMALALSCGNDGDAWIINRTGIWNVREAGVTPVAPIPGVIPYGTSQVLPRVLDKALFASVYLPPAAAGIWQYQQGHWAKLEGSGLPGRPTVEYFDPQHRLWVGYGGGLITLPLEGGGRRFSSGTPGLGNVHALLRTSNGMFAAGGNGLAVLREMRFEMLRFDDPASARGVGGLVESLNGDLWLNASRGVVHVAVSELRSALANPAYSMKSELVTEGEFVGPVDLLKRENAARDAEGNLWFAQLNGVFHFAPDRVHPPSRPPIVSVKSLSADGRPLGSDATIGPRPQTLEIQYLGVDLTDPDRVVYRYRLEGFEDSWQDAGHRTVAIYTHLPPGTFTFRVMASNGNGVWTDPVSLPPLSIPPSFFQTTWFRVLCALAGLLLLFGIVAVRVRSVTGSIRARAEERADERVRIARDLHDTLLQGIQGLLLHFHVAAQKVAPDEESKQLLEHALATADRIILEGRNRVSSLRSEHVTDAELLGSIENVGLDLARGGNAQFVVERSGIPATLHAHVADEILYIAREALANAFRHSKATRINVELNYGKRYFTLSCKDNGRGFAPREHQKAGHWGLKGMAERVRTLRGELRCESTSHSGTAILVLIPSYLAYPRHSRAMFYLRALREK